MTSMPIIMVSAALYNQHADCQDLVERLDRSSSAFERKLIKYRRQRRNEQDQMMNALSHEAKLSIHRHRAPEADGASLSNTADDALQVLSSNPRELVGKIERTQYVSVTALKGQVNLSMTLMAMSQDGIQASVSLLSIVQGLLRSVFALL